jgi:hypothetical protein
MTPDEDFIFTANASWDGLVSKRRIWPRLVLALTLLTMTSIVVVYVLLSSSSAAASAAGGCGGG